MSDPVLSYARPTAPHLPRWIDPPALSALQCGGSGFAAAAFGVGATATFPVVGIYAAFVGLLFGGVLMLGGLIMGSYAVAVGPRRGLALAWLVIQATVYLAAALAGFCWLLPDL